jgi:flagella basal body P-ring formation protein FlgA
MTTANLLLAAATCLPVEGPRILARHLSPAEPAFAAVPPDTAVADSPSPGWRRALSAADLDAALTRAGASAGASGPLCAEYRTVEPPVAEITAAFRAALAERFPESANWTVSLADHARAPVPPGPVRFHRISSVAPDSGSASRLYRGYVGYAGGRRFPLWARFRTEVEAARLVAARDLVPGVPVDREWIREERVRIPAPGPATAVSAADLAGKAPARAIPAGSALDRSQFRSPPLVSRGDRVRVDVRSGAARLTLSGLAESTGRMGDRIAVANAASGRRFMAVVEGPGVVAVDVAAGSRGGVR